MISKVRTRNSLYEIDWNHYLVRRVDGAVDPTDRFSPGGEWKPFVEILQYEEGKPLVVKWPDGQPVLRDHTVSSDVQSLEEDWHSEVQET